MSKHMAIEDRYHLINRYKDEYLRANRLRRGEILTVLEEVTELHRKSLTRLLRGHYRRHPSPTKRPRSYGLSVQEVLRVVSQAYDYPCAERLTPNLLAMAQHLERHGELSLPPQVVAQLSTISVSTVRRLLAAQPHEDPLRLRRPPTPSSPARYGVPTGRIPWDETEPGHVEVDLVHQGGRTSQGEYVHTLQMVDVATGWSELVAVLGRSYRVMADAFQRILARLPFPVLELHPDNGSEFFHHHLWRFWQERCPEMRWSRSRPYHKNDNRFVEQRNGALVRAYLGKDRLDTAAQTRALNQLYDAVWLYFNFFQPVMRLQEKQPLVTEGPSRVRRVFDQARTPFERLCAAQVLAPEKEQALRQLQEQTNPRALRDRIHRLREELFALPNATAGVSEDIYETLFQPIMLQKGEGPSR